MTTTMNLIKCPVCERECKRLWGKRNGYLLYNCLSCTHKFADLRNIELLRDDPILFREKITNGLMATDAQYYDHLAAGEEAGNTTSITTEKILDLYHEKAVGFTGSWLDIGCGSGHLLSIVQDAGFVAHGIEPGGWGQIAAARKGLKIVQGFLTNDTFSQCFDVVSATDVVEHLSNPVQFLGLMARYVVSDGYVIISIPFVDSFEARLMGVSWNMVAPPTHCQFFSTQSLELALQLAGLKMIGRRQFNIRNIPLFSRNVWVRRLIDLLFPGPQLVCVLQKVSH